jgi:hypothetical protein
MNLIYPLIIIQNECRPNAEISLNRHRLTVPRFFLYRLP